MSSIPERALQPTRAQLETLLDLLEKNPNLVKEVAKSPRARDLAHSAWQRIAVRLNAMGGCTKTSKQWNKYWTDKKCSAKRKAIQSLRARKQPGAEPIELSIWDERILRLMGDKINLKEPEKPDQESIDGTSTTRELHIQIVDETVSVKQSPPSSPGVVSVPDSPEKSRTPSPLELEDPLDILSERKPPKAETKRPRRRRLNSLITRKQSVLTLTERCLRLEEQRVEVDRRNSRMMEVALNLLREREASTSQLIAGLTKAVLVVGEGLKQLAETMNK